MQELEPGIVIDAIDEMSVDVTRSVFHHKVRRRPATEHQGVGDIRPEGAETDGHLSRL